MFAFRRQYSVYFAVISHSAISAFKDSLRLNLSQTHARHLHIYIVFQQTCIAQQKLQALHAFRE